jgi:hypothetical protein
METCYKPLGKRWLQAEKFISGKRHSRDEMMASDRSCYLLRKSPTPAMFGMKRMKLCELFEEFHVQKPAYPSYIYTHFRTRFHESWNPPYEDDDEAQAFMPVALLRDVKCTRSKTNIERQLFTPGPIQREV